MTIQCFGKREAQTDINPPRKKRAQTEGVVEMLRDDAFFQAHQDLKPTLIRTFEASLLKAGLPKINKGKLKICEMIAKNKSRPCANILWEIYYQLEASSNTRRCSAIVDFARNLIDKLPDREQGETTISNQAKELAKILGEHVNLDSVPQELALLIQEKLDDNEREVSDEEFAVLQELGQLLLVAQSDINGALDAVQAQDIKEAGAMLSEMAEEIFATAQSRIHEHVQAHKKVSIQGDDEAAFHKMSLEMANLLLLESGGINFGIVEQVFEAVVPEYLKETEAAKHLCLVLEELVANDEAADILSRALPPKSPELISNTIVRTTLGLDANKSITKRDVQLTILSALLGHMRQAFAGTCFTTCFLIKALYNYLPMVITDMVELIREGRLTRRLINKERTFPLILRTTNEYLGTKIWCRPDGTISKTEHVRYSPDQQASWGPVQKGARLDEAPGIAAACRAMGLVKFKEIVNQAACMLPSPFTPNTLIRFLAEAAFAKQKKITNTYSLKLTLEELVERGQFAFGSETNHPLHRSYEQTSASMVAYFGSQYYMGSWVHLTAQEVLKEKNKGFPPRFQAMYYKLLETTFLPTISRIRYLYNHNIEDYNPLFSPEIQPCSHTNYGYELYDSGLPKDFTYSNKLAKAFKCETSSFRLENFKKYSPFNSWKKIDTKERFIEFFQDVVKETAAHMVSQNAGDKALIEWALEKMCKDIKDPSFAKNMIFLMLGRGSTQKNEWLKNEQNMDTTPWKLKWGGDFTYVMKAYFNLEKSPSQKRKFKGTPKEVLVRCINFFKKQPAAIQEKLLDPRQMLVISSPMHAFLLTPHTNSFQKAANSNEDTAAYVENHVIAPGKAVAMKKLPWSIRNDLISYVANNSWFSPDTLKHDFERQELTEASKETFDLLLKENPEIFSLSPEKFCKKLVEIVAFARASDANIAKRNACWERIFARRLAKKLKDGHDKEALIDFARNRKNDNCLSKNSRSRFLERAAKISPKLSANQFRQELIKEAYEVYTDQQGGLDRGWKEHLCKSFDTKLFSLLPEQIRHELIKTGIATHDFNWKRGVHDCHALFMVNPATAKLELCNYMPDTGEIEFMPQGDWFKGSWEFPRNYIAYESGPLFPYKKLMGAI